MRSALPLLLLAFSAAASAQSPWDIRDPGAAVDVRCGECVRTMETMPKEVMFGLFVDDDLDIWFVLNDPRFFDRLFKRPGDGIAVDVVERGRYACGREVPAPSGWSKGTLLKPVYLAEMLRERGTAEDGSLYTKVGRLPLPFKGKPVELNMLVVQDHYACWYNTFHELDSHRWDLLNMGLFMDSLTYHERVDSSMTAIARPVLRRKALHFTIPFAKGGTIFSAADIRPLVDSLRLTEFAIRHIDIHAYSSVEGPEEENIRLQEERALGIARALQEFQAPGVRYTVSASENWVEFLQDIAGTRHANLADLSRNEVKARLRDRTLARSLEPLLARHRKAMVTLELQRRTAYTDMAAEKLITAFERSLEERNLERAAAIQREVFERVMDRELPMDFIDRLEVPHQKPFALLLNSRAAFRQFTDPRDVFATYQALQELDRLAPGSAPIKYNLCAVKFRLWLAGEQALDPEAFRLEIDRLLSYGIDAALVQRMHVNRHIILAETYMRQGDYRRKDECLAYIAANYHKLPMSPMDHLNLAQYFTSYGDRDRALEVIVPHLTGQGTSRDLLFYYLNLTLVDEGITTEPRYRQLLQQAIRVDRRRFCRMFLPFGKGGISFQLLEDAHLRELYCLQCAGTYDG